MSEQPAIRLCTACAHYRSDRWSQWCGRDHVVDPVDGHESDSRYSCGAERMATRYDPSLAFYVSTDPCGPEGKHWAAKPVPPDVRPWWEITRTPRSWWRRLLGLPPKPRDYPLRNVPDHVFANFPSQ